MNTDINYDLSYLANLPHDVQKELLLRSKLSAEQILDLCKVIPALSWICTNYYFWRDKTVRDFNVSPEFFDRQYYYLNPVDRYLVIRKHYGLVIAKRLPIPYDVKEQLANYLKY